MLCSLCNIYIVNVVYFIFFSYDTVFINLTHKPEWYLEKHAQGKVPLLEFDNGNILFESLIICDYLDEKFQQRPLYPKDPFRKAQDRILIDKFGTVRHNTFYTGFI